MKAITFSLTTVQPLLATSFQGDPNSDVSYSYIPGSMIRGAIIGRYLKAQRIQDLDHAAEAEAEAVRQLFFTANSTRYLNAYLSGQNQQRTLPIPRSWFREKDQEFDENTISVDLYDFSVDRDSQPETPKSVGNYYWCNERGVVTCYNEKRRINVHNQRDRKKGRATKDQGEIFRYDALDVGQTFQGVILCDDVDEPILRGLLEKSEDIWLGGSQSAGYGHTRISRDSIKIYPSWCEVHDSLENRAGRDGLTITLLSDALLRDQNGQSVADPGLVKEAISSILAISCPEVKKGGIFASSTLIGGFNRKWGLPLPQLPALAAGSVIVFDVDDCPLTEAQIRHLEEQGIGDRREDGFGRVVVNWLNEKTFNTQRPGKHLLKQSILGKSSRTLADEMAKRMIQQKLEQELVKRVGYLPIQGNIKNSQLSRLHLVARQALSSKDCNAVSEFLNNLPKNARDQFSSATLGSKPLRTQLDEWLKHPETWLASKPEVTIAGVTYPKDGELPELDREYTLRLIMAVAKKATKERE